MVGESLGGLKMKCGNVTAVNSVAHLSRETKTVVVDSTGTRKLSRENKIQLLTSDINIWRRDVRINQEDSCIMLCDAALCVTFWRVGELRTTINIKQEFKWSMKFIRCSSWANLHVLQVMSLILPTLKKHHSPTSHPVLIRMIICLKHSWLVTWLWNGWDRGSKDYIPAPHLRLCCSFFLLSGCELYEKRRDSGVILLVSSYNRQFILKPRGNRNNLQVQGLQGVVFFLT